MRGTFSRGRRWTNLKTSWGVRKSWELWKYQISQLEILFGTVESGKSHLESRGFAKHIENGVNYVTNRKCNLIGNFVLFFLLFDCFDGYMWMIKSYNDKVLTVKGFYALKCIGTYLYHPIVLDTNHWEKRKFPIPNFRNSHKRQTTHQL